MMRSPMDQDRRQKTEEKEGKRREPGLLGGDDVCVQEPTTTEDNDAD